MSQTHESCLRLEYWDAMKAAKKFQKGSHSQKSARFLITYVRNCCNTWRHTATTYCNTLQHTATHCSTLHHTATHWHCNTLHHTVLEDFLRLRAGEVRQPQHPETTHRDTLQHTATHCNTLQHTETNCNRLQHTCTATRCTTLY